MKKEFFIFALVMIFSSNLAYGSTYSLETSDMPFEISLPAELISVENNEFVVLVDWVEVDYDVSTQNEVSILQFFVPVDSQELEIIGTQVIPEFPLGVLMVFTTMIVIVTLVTKIDKFRIR